MNKQFFMIIAVCAALVLGACGAKEPKKEENGAPKPLAADLQVPDKADVDEEVKFQTKVTQGAEAVSDADEVKYEVWRDGKKESSEMIEAKSIGKGRYTAKKAFEADGVYYVQVHVTARGLHTMPKAAITVGKAAAPKKEEKTSDDHQH
ncbi:FixH family protein [Bacillus xiapuensis]|uniref:FixH family protein n=1 Tax=Bacillus xiapuensis TaxID=2014075 RepID=UPI000C24AF60|nr:FixH family protein [Bacillus xiapuensis]